MEKTIHTLEELKEEAAIFVRALVARERGATLVTLWGELGAGKTAFTKLVASALGVEDTVTSPTFVLEKIYTLPQGQAFERLIHIDAYRLESSDELAPLELETLMQDSKNLIMFEWPEKAGNALPMATIAISLTAHEDGSRTLIYG